MLPEHEQKLSVIFVEIFGDDATRGDGGQRLMDMESWDSLAHMRFVIALEGEFQFQLTGDEIADMQSIDDVKKVVTARAGEAR